MRPRLERWYCDRDTIQPKHYTNRIIGGSNKDVLGYNVAGDVYNQYYKIAKEVAGFGDTKTILRSIGC